MRPLCARPGDAPNDRLRRRVLLLSAITIPGTFLATRLARLAGDCLTALASSARPAAAGSSASRCAACGAVDHTMLDSVCPLAPAVGRPADA